jgi:hypothetical protein
MVVLSSRLPDKTSEVRRSLMAKTKKGGLPKEKSSKRKRKREINPSQTNEPFEQDSKRRIGPFGGAGEHPRMQ